MIRVKEFEKLDLEKFNSLKFENSFLIFGGNISETTAPDGGYTCDTDAGTWHYSDGTSFNYKKDRYSAVYDPVTNTDVEVGRDFNL